MVTIEMAVSLKVPDNVAITAFNTLKRIGYKQLKRLERSDYYKFDVKGNINKFKEDISKADILVNANKHKFSFTIQKNNKKNNKIKYQVIGVLVQDLDNRSSLLSTLKERLSLKNIKKFEKGILWTMHFDKKTNAKDIAGDITKNLLMNENYQKYKILK
jgi:phosphoribosylformylglycinamidine (FGAM) synthase PurS component